MTGPALQRELAKTQDNCEAILQTACESAWQKAAVATLVLADRARTAVAGQLAPLRAIAVAVVVLAVGSVAMGEQQVTAPLT
jgi:hypothetical protein